MHGDADRPTRRAPRPTSTRPRCKDAALRRPRHLRPVHAASIGFGTRPEHGQRARARPALGRCSPGLRRHRLRRPLRCIALRHRTGARERAARGAACCRTAPSPAASVARALVSPFGARLPRRLSRSSLSRSPGCGGSLKWIDNFGIQILIYVMLGWGLNIVVGLAGLLDLGYVAFYAVGAYSYALLADDLRPVVLDLPAARRHPRRVLGHPARLPGAAAARRLSRHRDAGLRRDHPPRADQLGRRDQRLCRHHRRSRGRPSSAFPSPPATTASPPCSASSSRPIHRTIFLYYLILGAGAAHRLRHAAAAPPADRARLGGAARGRDRLPLARHQHHQHQAHRLRHRRHVRRLRRLVLRRAPGLHLARKASPSWNRRSSSPSSCSAAWAARSASPSPPS